MLRNLKTPAVTLALLALAGQAHGSASLSCVDVDRLVEASDAILAQNQTSLIVSGSELPPSDRAAKLKAAFSAGDDAKIHAAALEIGLSRREAIAIHEIHTNGKSGKRYYESLSDSSREMVDRLNGLSDSAVLDAAGKVEVNQSFRLRNVPMDFRHLPAEQIQAFARALADDYLPSEINDRLLASLGWTDSGVNARLYQCLKDPICVRRSSGQALAQQAAARLQAAAAKQTADQARLLDERASIKKHKQQNADIAAADVQRRKEAKAQVRLAAAQKKQAPVQPAPPTAPRPAPQPVSRPSDQAPLSFSTNKYYGSKHLKPDGVNALLSDLTSADAGRMQAASDRLDVLFRALQFRSHVSYQGLPAAVRSQVDEVTWEHLRNRSRTLSGQTSYFESPEQLADVGRSIQLAWISRSRNLQLVRTDEASGVATYAFTKDGTRYSVIVCLHASSKCEKAGEVKTFYSECGEADFVLSLAKLREGSQKIGEAVRRSRVSAVTQGPTTQNSLEFTPSDFGLSSRPCP